MIKASPFLKILFGWAVFCVAVAIAYSIALTNIEPQRSTIVGFFAQVKQFGFRFSTALYVSSCIAGVVLFFTFHAVSAARTKRWWKLAANFWLSIVGVFVTWYFVSVALYNPWDEFCRYVEVGEVSNYLHDGYPCVLNASKFLFFVAMFWIPLGIPAWLPLIVYEAARRIRKI